jgi:hypothetical protein
MIFISKLIAKFIKAVLSLLSSSEEHVETSEVIVASVGSFTSSDKIIQPLPIVNTYLLPDRGVFFPVANGFVLSGTNYLYTENFSTWTSISNNGITTGRVLPAGSTAPFGYNQIPLSQDAFGMIEGVPSNSLLLSSLVGFNVDNRICYFTNKTGITSFLYRGRRIYIGKQWAWVSNKLNTGDELISTGWFPYNNFSYQSYSPLEREVMYRRIQVPHPYAGLTISNVTQPENQVISFLENASTLSVAENPNGDIYGLHRDNIRVFLTKNFAYTSCWLANSLDNGYSLNTTNFTFPTSIFGHYYRESVADLLVGENGEASPQVACIDTDVFISQYNKIFKLNNNLELQNIYEVPFCVQQMTADISHLYLLHKGGISKCLP